MDIFDKMQTLPPEVALFVASLFVERKEALELKRRKWWEEIK